MASRIFSLALLSTTATSAFSQIAYDHAEDPVYTVGQEYIQVGTPPGDQSGAVNGLNGGYGWNRWQRGGYGSPPDHGTTLITNVNASFGMGNQQFGLRSGPGGNNGADARRRLLNPLVVGDQMKWSMMAGGGGAGTLNSFGEFGCEVRSGLLSNPGRDMLNCIGEMGRNWRVFRAGGTINSNLPVVGGQRVDAVLTILPGDQFSLQLTAMGGGTDTVGGTFLSLGQQVQTAQFYCFGTDGDFYVNNLCAVPEPASILALAGAALFVGLRRRK